MSLSTVTLTIRRDGATLHTLPLTDSPVHLGRALDNTLVLTDHTVSGHHATVWIDPSGLWIADHRSRNGTFVNDQRVVGPTRIRAGDRIRLGTALMLEVSGNIPVKARTWVVEDIDTGLRWPIRGQRFYIGSGPDVDLYIPDTPARMTILVFYEDGEVWLGDLNHEVPLDPSRPFEAAGRRFRLVEVDGIVDETVESNAERYPYRLLVALNGPNGPGATVSDVRSQKQYRVETDNRAVLLYLLARRRLTDIQQGMSGEDAGWCSDEETTTGIWGKYGTPEPNNLHVLLHRLRKELEKAGFDPWFIEKRRRAVRVRLTDIVVTDL